LPASLAKDEYRALTLAILIAAGYLAGSIPTGYWFVRALKGVDIRTIGSGTIGASNASRAFGGGGRLAVLLLVMAIDAGKGFAPTFVAMTISGPGVAVATGSAALLGNYRPVFMRFQRGGKMVATGGGVLFGLAPKAAAIGLGIWIVVALLTRYASVASLAVAVLMPAIEVLTGRPWEIVVFTIVVAAAVFVLHRANLRRLLNGTEHRLSLRSGSSSRAGPSSGRAA
jgi:glycerol-3-phosphate acyltransferase PlsY